MSVASAQDTTLTPQKKSVNRKSNVEQVSEQRKEQLLSFVSENHPELKDLLSKLEKSKKQRQYLNAIRGLNKSVTKLETTKERNPQRYESALQQWNLESRIKVAGAQVKTNDTEEGRSTLESLVTKLVDFHIARMKSDREQIQKRLDQVEKRIADAESNRERAIEKRINSATRTKKKVKKKD
jgi:hypothetical protein